MENDPNQVNMKGIVKGGLKNSGRFNFNDVSYPSMTMNNGKSSDGKDERINEDTYNFALGEIDKLKQEIKQINKNHDESIIEALKRGQEDGFNKGLLKGKEEAVLEVDGKLEVLQQEIAQAFQVLGQEKEKYSRDLLQGSQQILLALISKIVGKLADGQTQFVEQAVKKAIEALGNESNLVIKVAPIEHEYVKDNHEFWIPINKHLDSIKVEPDPRITKGGCLIETEAGSIDMRLETCLSQLEEIVSNGFAKLHNTGNTKNAEEVKASETNETEITSDDNEDSEET
jgi:flagellar assembly protein FliH